MAATGREPFHMTGERAPMSAQVGPRSPWHSPVPYLFGGLAAMLGLIAFALLILACSYWKLSGYLENSNEEQDRDLEAGEGKNGEQSEKQSAPFEPQILVIMAGQLKPTFLATPMSSRLSSFGDASNKSCSCGEEKGEKLEEGGEVELDKQGSSGGEQSRRLESREEPPEEQRTQ